MDIKDVEKLAELARIELTEAEKESMLLDMKGILEYVKIIEGVQLQATEVNYTHYNVWREDKSIERDFSESLILDQFPDAQDGFLKVKKIL